MIASTSTRAAALPQTSRVAAEDNANAEYDALLAQVRAFSVDDWAARTDCTEWTVRDMVAHLAGASEEAVRVGRSMSHMARAVRRLRQDPSRDLAAHLCDLQIARRSEMSNAELGADLERWAKEAPRSRRRQPAPMRAMPMPGFAGLRPGARLSYLLDVIFTRDLWMHRIDLARATGQPMPASTAEGEVVAQVVRDLDLEWTGPAIELALTGRGGGEWVVGDGKPAGRVTGDSVDVLRSLSGRAGDVPLGGPARLADAIRAARVVF